MRSARVRQRLTAWYALSTLGLLLVALLLMRGYARTTLQRQHDAAIEQDAELVRSFFRAEFMEYRRVEFTVRHMATELVFARLAIEVLAPDGSVFATGMRPGTDSLDAPVAERVVPLENALAPGWRLRLRYSEATLAAAEERLDRLTLVAAVVSLGLAALVAWFMTGRALAPVGEMARNADQLRLHPAERLPIPNPGDEFGRLGLAFNQLLERLEGVLRQQQRFLADAAHELRTPVARMLSESESRLAEPASAEDRESLARIRSELQRTSRLVDQLLHVAQSDAGARSAEHVALFLDDVVVDAIAPWEGEASRRGLELDVSDVQEARVTGEPTLLLRMVGALVENALRYTPDGGQIALRVHATDQGTRLVVEDSGIGIPMHERVAIFERFRRGGEASRVAPMGSGLGLAIAAGIARQHGAEISVGDSPLGGARFEVAFPPASAAATS